MNGGRGICQQKLLPGLGIRPVFSNSRGLPRVLPEEWMLAAGTASHVNSVSYLNYSTDDNKTPNLKCVFKLHRQTVGTVRKWVRRNFK